MALISTPLCDFGTPLHNFTAKDPLGNAYSIADQVQKNGLLVMFICNHCPYVIAIIDRLIKDCQKLQENDIGILAIMSNDYRSYPDDAPDKMLDFSKKHHFTFPYLIDETQDIAKQYDAVCTPDFFGYNHKKELQYRGRIDDAKMSDPTNRTPELLNAMLQIAKTGQGPTQQHASMGCSIKWR